MSNEYTITHQRTVNLSISQSESNNEIERTKEFRSAIGYGVLWGNSAHVNVHVDKDGNIGCSHCRINEAGEHKQFFYMEGIRDKKDGTYSFHS